MSTHTNILLAAGIVAAAAYSLGAQAAGPDAAAAAQQPQSETHATVDKSPPAKSARTLDRNWWEEERALDDGYVWPLPSASRMR